MTRTGMSVIAGLLVASAVHAADRHVVVPETTWPQLLPYIEAKLRVEYVDGAISVGTSGATYERKTVEPYDEALGELATVLLAQGVGERKVQKVLGQVARALKDENVNPTAISRDELFAIYWKKLTADDQFTGPLRELFLAAKAAGRLECFICDKGFEPQHLEVR